MIRRSKIFWCMTFFLLSACVPPQPTPNNLINMVQGKIVSLVDGNEMSLEFENTGCPHQGNTMTALNKKTGETFKGNYIINRLADDSTSVVRDTFGFKTGTIETSSEVNYVVKGILSGNKGTIMPITIFTGPQVICIELKNPEVNEVVKLDIYQNAYGEASDNHGTKYQVFLSGNAVKRQLDNMY